MGRNNILEFTIDCADLSSSRELHLRLAKTLHFPEWYGCNLDALYDCLTSINEDTHLFLSGFQASSPALRPFARVFSDVCRDNPHIRISF